VPPLVRPVNLSALKPFVPSGKDFELAKRFFTDLGVRVNWEAPGYAELQLGAAAFILQAIDHQVRQENFMVSVAVDDLDAWWQHILDSGVLERYAAARARPPTDYPWGSCEVHVIDVGGVCWHFRGEMSAA
jgi:uncharacterized glyoxalase superfamily protein PhnB